jgi:predicted transport protein
MVRKKITDFDGELTRLVAQNFIAYNEQHEIFQILYNMDSTNTSPISIHATDQGEKSQKQKTKTIHT